MMEVVVTSREFIKPLSPTPNHLHRVQLSFLDQTNNQNWFPSIFCYPKASNCHLIEIRSSQSHVLKKSLAEFLTKFYPLAGRVRDNLFIECNDMGVPFFETQAHCQLSHVLNNVNLIDLNSLLPYYELHDAGDQLLAIQVNFFDCGGVAIGTCFSHKFSDALSMVTLVNTWAAIALAGHSNGVIAPKFDLATRFPPRDVLGYKKMSNGVTKQKVVVKKFLFNAAAISRLKAKYAMNTSGAKPPSRVEAVTAFIWSRFMAATQARGFSVLTQGMNLRARMNPPLPLSYCGNLSHFALAIAFVDKTSTTNEGGHGLITQMRNAIRKIDREYVKELQEGKIKSMISYKEPTTKVEETPQIMFTSLSTFPLYEVDFGWGKPISVCAAVQPFKNLVSLLPTSSGDGIEAWINMKEDDIAKLEADKEFSSTLAGAHIPPTVSSL